MPAFSTLLRLFLCVCLALNGTGAFAMDLHVHAAANVADAASHAAHDRSAHAPMAVAMDETHRSAFHHDSAFRHNVSHHDVAQPDMDCCPGDRMAGHGTDAPTDNKKCCNPASCHCPCSQHMGVVASHFVQAPRVGVSSVSLLRSADRDAPPVPRLIRPPIA
ncbi:MAG: CopL family metal-binding regulatory protein [Pseudoxanthomonas sp.]